MPWGWEGDFEYFKSLKNRFKVNDDFFLNNYKVFIKISCLLFILPLYLLNLNCFHISHSFTQAEIRLVGKEKMYLNVSSWQILTECLFCTKNYARYSGEYKSSMVPDLCPQSSIERLNKHEIAKQCTIRISAHGRGTDSSSEFQRRKHWEWAEVEWTDGLQGWFGPGGLSLKS